MHIRSEKGLTLVEVIVAIAIMGIIMIPITLVFTTAYTNFTKESDKVAAQQAARDVLYGKGINSYGVMGDLERSDATSADIILDGIISDSASPDFNKYRSIKIKSHITDANNIDVTSDVDHTYSFDGSTLKYEVSNPSSSGDYFNGQKSSNGHDVEVKRFTAEKVENLKDPATDTDRKTETELIKITVTVTCGQSGDITLGSSYRIPNIEK